MAHDHMEATLDYIRVRARVRVILGAAEGYVALD